MPTRTVSLTAAAIAGYSASEGAVTRVTPTSRLLMVSLVASLLAGGCGPATTEGYWEGKGKANQLALKDRFRELTRKADFEFWFVVNKDGNAAGEIELVYDAELRVENLPQVALGQISFSPKVGGKVTDLNPKRRFPLAGFTDGARLALEIAQPEADRKTIEFTIRADPGVSAGLGAVPMTIPGGAAGVGDVQVMRIDMKPFTPFNAPAKVEKHPDGPFAARFEERGKDYAIEWSARQMGGEQRKANLTPEMRDAIGRLRRQLGQ